MGASTFGVGLLPTYEAIGLAAPLILVTLRLLQGLALGGEYGGAATYVAEHASDRERGYATSWIQTTATLGFFLSLLVIGTCRGLLAPEAFTSWGWRIPFLVSLALLLFSVYIRLKLEESPVFRQMKAQGKGSKAPLRESFLRYPNNKYVVLALLGATAGQGVVWYTGQFYALFFLTISLKLDYLTAYTMVGISLALATPFFIVFGKLSDRIGRLKIILAGCLIAALTYFPLFKGLAHFVNPALEEYTAANPITVAADDCNFHVFVTPGTRFSDCDRAKDFLTKAGLSFESLPGVSGQTVVTRIGTGGAVGAVGAVEVTGWDEDRYKEALARTGYPAEVDKSRINHWMTVLILFIMVLYVTMVYGPIAAFLVELFPTRIRYTSMSLPYHIGNGWFGGMLPLLATAMVARAGNIYAGLWYPIAVSLMTVIIGALFLRETKDRSIQD
jgi:MFS family permease